MSGTRTDLKRRILVVEDEHLLRDLLVKTLESRGFEVAASGSAADAKTKVENFNPEAMIVDIELGPGPNGLDLAEVIGRQHPSVGIVFLTNLPDPRIMGRGSTDIRKNQAYLRKSGLTGGNEILDALDAVLKKQETSEFRHDLEKSRPLAELSSGQIDTLVLMSEGKTNQQIADLRGTSVRAVESMITRIFQALNIDSTSANPRVEAVAAFLKLKGN